MDPKTREILSVLIERITSPPILVYPEYDKSFVVHTDVSQDGLGAVLHQKQSDVMRVIAYASRTLIPAEKNYHLLSGKLEFLALKWADRPVPRLLVLRARIYRTHGQQPPYLSLDHG